MRAVSRNAINAEYSRWFIFVSSVACVSAGLWCSEATITQLSNSCHFLLMKLKHNPSRLHAPKPVSAGGKSASWRVDRSSSSARGYTYEWQQARAEFLRSNHWCVMCRKRGRFTAATVIDHINPHNGDMVLFWDRTNWQSLCTTCHSKHKQRLERDTSKRAKPAIHTQPAT